LSKLPFAVDDEQHIPDYSIMPRKLHVLAGIRSGDMRRKSVDRQLLHQEPWSGVS